MGSGKFAKGYLVRDGRYLLQSPVTWYAGGTADSEKGTLGISPGYDSPANAGFGRAVTDECMFCHSGTLTRSDNRHFFTVTELSIGCERCHGPGETHIKHYETIAQSGPDAVDPAFRDSIVHPGKLNRLQSESLCGQCHCQGEAQVPVAGRSEWEFRPGDDFARFKMNYDSVVGDQPNTRFVGHFPQLHASKCYQGSETMTCVTCHNPHQHADGQALVDLQRQQCLQCHQDESCGVPLPDRIARNENQCVSCHMPRTKSQVPHTSTTNHRIAIYDDASAATVRLPNQAAQEIHIAALQYPPAEMTEGEAARMRALGAYWLFRKHLGDPRMTSLARTAGDSMQQVIQSGHGNDEIHANLAMLTFLQIPMVPPGPDQQATVTSLWEWAMGFAQQALEQESTSSESREAALEVAGRFLYRAGQHQSAASVYAELTKRRRRKEDWATLGISLAQLGDLNGSQSALRESIRINGGDPDLYETLAIVLGQSDREEATRLKAIADRIRRQNFTSSRAAGEAER
jgi:predicted CXXCH cytochrome family protein